MNTQPVLKKLGLMFLLCTLSGCVAGLAIGGVIPLGAYAISCVTADECPKVFGSTTNENLELAKESGYIDVSSSGAKELRGPGSIVTASALNGLKFEGNIIDCIDEDLRPEIIVGKHVKRKGELRLPRIEFELFAWLDDAGSNSLEVSAVDVSFNEIVESSVEYDDLIEAILYNHFSFSAQCGQILRLSNSYLVLSTLRVEGVQLRLRDSVGQLIAVTEESLSQYYTFSKSQKISITKSVIMIDTPMQIAIGSFVPQSARHEEVTPLFGILKTYDERARKRPLF